MKLFTKKNKLCIKTKNFVLWAKKNQKKLLITASCVVTAIILIVSIWLLMTKVIIPSKTYDEANSLIKKQDYAKAYEKLRELGDYEDAKEIKKDFLWLPVSQTSTYSNITGTFTTSYEYDKNGNRIMEITSSSTGDQSSVESTYDKKGNCTKRVNTDPYGTRTVECSYVYDGDLVKEMTTTSIKGETIVSKYEYDKYGNCIKNTSIFPNDIKNEETTKYNKDNKPVKKHVKTASGYEEFSFYTYDKNGNCTKVEKKDKDGNIRLTTVNTYNSNDELISVVETDADGGVDKTEYTLNKYGQHRKVVHTDAGGNTTTTEYTEYKVFYLK